jgi:hypothetical protein
LYPLYISLETASYVELTVEQVNQLPIWYRQKTASSNYLCGGTDFIDLACFSQLHERDRG